MAIQSRVALKALFENGDTPEGDNYADWLDSFLHLTDTSAQTVASPMTFSNTVKIATVSADALVLSGAATLSTVISTKMRTDTISVSAIASVATLFADTATATKLISTSAEASFLTASALTVHGINFLVETTVAATAVGSAIVPSTAAGFFEVLVSGSTVLIPYYVKQV